MVINENWYYRQARLLNMSMGIAANAQRELEQRGFIRKTR
jgi:hypothetical protein